MDREPLAPATRHEGWIVTGRICIQRTSGTARVRRANSAECLMRRRHARVNICKRDALASQIGQFGLFDAKLTQDLGGMFAKGR